MPKTLIESRFFPNKNKNKTKPELKDTISNSPPNLQIFKQKLLSGNGLLVYK